MNPGYLYGIKQSVPSAWLQLSLKAPPSALDAISNFLIERGSPGVVIKRSEVQAFFSRPAKSSSLKRDVRRFLRGIRGSYPRIEGRPLRWTVLKDRNWNDSWRRFFSPQRVGRGFWITPPWVDPPRSSGRKVIIIEPGMAFGTGTHATTRGCLEFLEEVVGSSRRGRITALDVGTGSGILAIAMAKMGAGRIWALDTDPVAVKTARANVKRNRVERTVRLSLSGPGRVRGSFTVVVANLTAETIIELAAVLRKKVSPGGYLILSGILKPKEAGVLREFSPGAFAPPRRKIRREWVTLLLRKKK